MYMITEWTKLLLNSHLDIKKCHILEFTYYVVMKCMHYKIHFNLICFGKKVSSQSVFIINTKDCLKNNFTAFIILFALSQTKILNVTMLL